MSILRFNMFFFFLVKIKMEKVENKRQEDKLVLKMHLRFELNSLHGWFLLKTRNDKTLIRELQLKLNK